jgi:putative flippase GtrA
MTTGDIESGRIVAGADAGSEPPDLVRRLADYLPRPLRFLGVGALGLITDLGVFTAIIVWYDAPLVVRLISLAVATLVTWRLNRALTFERSGRRPHDEALRYVAVTLVAQGTSYGVFAALVLTVLAPLPQVALIVGSAVAAAVSYHGHRRFAFAPVNPAAANPHNRGVTMTEASRP